MVYFQKQENIEKEIVVTGCSDCPFVNYEEILEMSFCDHPFVEGFHELNISTRHGHVKRKAHKKCPLRSNNLKIILKETK